MIFLKNSGIQVGTMILNTIDFFKWLQFANATWPMIYVYFVPRAAPSPSLTWGCLACPTLPPSSTRRSLAFLRLARPRPKSCRQLMAAPRRPTSWQSRCRATTGSWTGLSGHSGCKSSRSSSSSRTQCCCDFPFCFGVRVVASALWIISKQLSARQWCRCAAKNVIDTIQKQIQHLWLMQWHNWRVSSAPADLFSQNCSNSTARSIHTTATTLYSSNATLYIVFVLCSIMNSVSSLVLIFEKIELVSFIFSPPITRGIACVLAANNRSVEHFPAKWAPRPFWCYSSKEVIKSNHISGFGLA